MSDRRPLIGANLLYVRPGYVGGTVRYAHEILRHLARLGRYRMVIYAQKDAFPITDPVLAMVRRREFKVVGGLFGRVMTEHGVLPWIARRDHVDLLFSPGFVSPLWGRFRKVVTIHDLYYRRFPHFVRPWQRRYWQVLVPASLRVADAAIAPSDSTCSDIRSTFPWAGNKVRRIHLGADALIPAPASVVAGKPFCLMVGNLTPNKNIATVVGAFARLKAMGVNCRLLVAGSDLFGELEGMLSGMADRPDIEMIEHVDDGALAALYSQALCLIQASRYEGFGLPVVEAMELGCPVIASDIGVLREVGGDAAVYVPPDSPDTLADAIARLAGEPGFRSGLSAAGRENAQRFRWEEAARQTALVFDSVLGGRK